MAYSHALYSSIPSLFKLSYFVLIFFHCFQQHNRILFLSHLSNVLSVLFISASLKQFIHPIIICFSLIARNSTLIAFLLLIFIEHSTFFIGSALHNFPCFYFFSFFNGFLPWCCLSASISLSSLSLCFFTSTCILTLLNFFLFTTCFYVGWVNIHLLRY